eukprot:7386611-Prymnesium_polylepis.2
MLAAVAWPLQARHRRIAFLPEPLAALPAANRALPYARLPAYSRPAGDHRALCGRFRVRHDRRAAGRRVGGEQRRVALAAQRWPLPARGAARPRDLHARLRAPRAVGPRDARRARPRVERVCKLLRRLWPHAGRLPVRSAQLLQAAVRRGQGGGAGARAAQRPRRHARARLVCRDRVRLPDARRAGDAAALRAHHLLTVVPLVHGRVLRDGRRGAELSELGVVGAQCTQYVFLSRVRGCRCGVVVSVNRLRRCGVNIWGTNGTGVNCVACACLHACPCCRVPSAACVKFRTQTGNVVTRHKCFV